MSNGGILSPGTMLLARNQVGTREIAMGISLEITMGISLEIAMGISLEIKVAPKWRLSQGSPF